MRRRPRTDGEKQQARACQNARWTKIKAMRCNLPHNLSTLNASLAMLEKAGLVQGVIDGCAEAIRDAKELLKPIIDANPHAENVPRANDVKIMIWAINKIGSIDAAIEAFSRARKALQ